MYLHEFIVDNYNVGVKGEVTKLPAFASIYPIRSHLFMVSTFALNFLPGPASIARVGHAAPVTL